MDTSNSLSQYKDIQVLYLICLRYVILSDTGDFWAGVHEYQGKVRHAKKCRPWSDGGNSALWLRLCNGVSCQTDDDG